MTKDFTLKPIENTTDYNSSGIKSPVWNISFPIEVFSKNIQEFILNASYVMDAPKEYFA